LSIDIDDQRYFIDAGSGWPSIHLFPDFEAIEYTVWGMRFKTIVESNGLHLHHKTKNAYQPMCYIPLESTDVTEIHQQIEHRYDDKSVYPFANSLRFSQVIDDTFIFLKGRRLREFRKDRMVERSLSELEIFDLLATGLQIDPKELRKFEIGRWI
jgi:N-acetyltransferase